jgi:transcriptional regulator with GAF, ATPase, and Fis domain
LRGRRGDAARGRAVRHRGAHGDRRPGRRGKFELADGGTLFLDEVSDLSPAAQAKLLRVVQDVAVERVGGSGTRRVNTRIVVATNRPLTDMVRQGQFRPDLYFRLGGVEIHVPPLRERHDDVIELAQPLPLAARTLRPAVHAVHRSRGSDAPLQLARERA